MSKADPLAGLKGMQEISFDSIAKRQQNDRLRPTLKEMAKDLGRPIKHKADGTPYIPADTGDKRQKDAVVGAIGPWAKAEVARVAEQNGYPGDFGGGLHGKVTVLGRIPRCQIEGGEHDFRESGRCWWCGAGRDAG